MTNNIPTLFDPPPTIERRNASYHSLQPELYKTQHDRICAVLKLHPMLRYDEIPVWYLLMFDAKIKESSVVGRLNELVKLEYVDPSGEKLNCKGKTMVTAYKLTQKGIDILEKENL